jgi:hypothetical protein
VAKTPADSDAVESMLANAQMFAESQEQQQARQKNGKTADEVSVEISTAAAGGLAHHSPFVAKGPHRFLTGTLKNVQCKIPELDLTVEAGGKTVALHSDNPYKVEFSTLGFTIDGDINPCKDLEGRLAKVEYVESADTGVAARVLSIELHK